MIKITLNKLKEMLEEHRRAGVRYAEIWVNVKRDGANARPVAYATDKGGYKHILYVG